MNSALKEITQISIYLKEEADRVNEVALFQPLNRTSSFNEESKPLLARKWRFNYNIPFLRRVALKFQSFLFKHFTMIIPTERLTPEAKFKTVLAMLLAQEEVRDFFLHPKRRNDFYQALKEAATACDYSTFTPPTSHPSDSPLEISRELTLQETKQKSLIDDLVELNLQIAALNYQQRCEILFRILNRVERPPITSVLEITSADATKSITLTTQYAKYKITSFELGSGDITYTYTENHATSSIRTLHNLLPDVTGTMNQRAVWDSENRAWIGSYCGELSTPFHVLEQILLILAQEGSSAKIVETQPTEEKKILFTSLYSWHEMGLITDQQASIRNWDQKTLLCKESAFKLNLLYYNIPFNALNNYPSPGEIKATIQDINDTTWISILAESWHFLNLQHEELTAINGRILSLRGLKNHSFLEREKAILEEIDQFRRIKKTLLEQIHSLPPTLFTLAITTLLSEKKPNGKGLKGIDKLLYLDYVAKHLGYIHNKNCQNSTDRTASADAADKAQYVYTCVYKTPFLPGHAKEEERAFFEVLYSMYLVWEEPEINTWLSTGFVGEKFYNNFFQKNPETTRYLLRWLKKHPEMYLGLSDYRT